MKHKLLNILIIFLLPISILNTVNAQGFVINHLNTNVDQIPDSVITKVQENYRLIHGHLSHGWQIDDGLDSLEVIYPKLAAEIGNYELPRVNNTLNVMYYYAAFGAYWYDGGAAILRNYLNANSSINVAVFSWCRDLDEYTADFVQAYLDTLSNLELDYPNIHFVYSTGNAQSNGDVGLLRFNNNNLIRNYCINNEKILYDFADLDSWWYNPETQAWEGSSYIINDIDVPVEHPQFHIELWHHTTVESGIQKAKAFWYMLARLTGWNEETVSIEKKTDYYKTDFIDVSTYPNPFNSTSAIKVFLKRPEIPELTIFNILGKKIYSEKSMFSSTEHTFYWNALNYSSGTYFYKIKSGIFTKYGKLLYLE